MRKINKEFIIESDKKIKALSYSQMSRFAQCRKSWEWEYKLRYSPKTDRRPLYMGTILHAGMAGYWKARALGVSQPRLSGVEAMKEEIAKQIPRLEDDLRVSEVEEDLLDEAVEVYYRTLDEFQSELWEPLVIDGLPLVEIRFAIPAVRGIPIQGFIDLVAEDTRDGSVWQIDWKFVSSLGGAEDEMFNMQNIMYQWALQKIGVEVNGSLTFKSYSKPSREPKILKSGEVSRAYIRCTWDRYAEFVKEAGGDPEEYREEMEPKLSQAEWSLEIREYFSPETVREIWDQEIRGMAHEILKIQTRYPRTISKMVCPGCPYREPCMGQIRGYDWESMLERDFQVRPEYGPGETDEDEEQD